MKLNVKRQTGFFGMGSSLTVFLGQQKAGALKHDETKAFEVTTESTELKVSFSFLRSQTYTIVADQPEKEVRVRVNPLIMKLYVWLFTLVFILPLIFKTWLLGVGILIVYLGFVAVMSAKFYLIDEIEQHG